MPHGNVDSRYLPQINKPGNHSDRVAQSGRDILLRVDTGQLSRTLAQWGSLYRKPPSRPISWAPADLILQAAINDSAVEEKRLRELLERSDQQLRELRNLRDPLLADAGLNRWLRGDREEAYSDWLAWILDQLTCPELVKLLGILDPKVASYCEQRPKFAVDRETVIPEGRLDLVIRFDPDAVLIVEVKTVSADEPGARIAKQKGYDAWLKDQPEQHRSAVLLAVDAASEDYEGFAPLRWGEVCIRLRRMIPDIVHRVDVVKTAMIIAFIGAVETNLLRLVTPYGRNHARRLFYARTAEHLQKSLEPN